MEYKNGFLNEFLSHPDVREVTASVNPSLAERQAYQPPRCSAFMKPYTGTRTDSAFRFILDSEAKRQLPDMVKNPLLRIDTVDFPDRDFKEKYHRRRTIGIVFSGGPAPGGHNVIAGLFDAAREANPDNRVLGFLMGPDGIIDNQVTEITPQRVDAFRNLGGFGMIKTGRTKIDTRTKMSLSRETCKKLGLDALVVVGGDDSNTNAAFLAQEMAVDGIQVIGVPKTIDGDVQVRDADGKVLCAMSFGFHTAARAFAQQISNLCTDCSSDMKYWHICKVMGRSASHLALEVALQTHANITLIGEDLAEYVDKDKLAVMKQTGQYDFSAYGMTLRHLSRIICDGVVRRAAVGKNCGVLVIPEGVLEFVNEIQVFIIKLNTIIAEYNQTHDQDFHQGFPRLEDKLDYLRELARRLRQEGGINIWNSHDDELFNDIPSFFQEGLLTERDSHGNFQFSLVETDKVIMGMVKDHLNVLREKGIYRLGIERGYFTTLLERDGLDPDRYGPVLFSNYNDGNDHLLIRRGIISKKTLKQTVSNAKLISGDSSLPAAVVKIYEKSVPRFKTQTHFYGYDGRGSTPTEFDCRYTYNLGLTVFSLIANGATGQMAAIMNLEKDFSDWKPVGIPIAPLMHLEERKGKLELVLEKCLVDTRSPAFKVVKFYREKWLAAVPGDDDYRLPGPIHFAGASEETRPITLVLNNLGQSDEAGG
ncbi:MAG: phosphofructokinase [Deltaproteobacteria bacterium]|nr:MAG: phosphofructokinase [Deltaproteobacteria bacterium]